LLAYSPIIRYIADSGSDKEKAMTLVFTASPYSTHSTHH